MNLPYHRTWGPRIGLVITKEPHFCPRAHGCENIEFLHCVCSKEDGNFASELGRLSVPYRKPQLAAVFS